MIKRIFISITALMVWLTATVFAAEENNTDSYTYISQEYNYSIKCPKRPNVVPATIFFDDANKKGEVLIFENKEYEVKRGWVVLTDAFNTMAVPNFNMASKELVNQYMTELQKQGYENMQLIDITKDNKGVFAITAKEIEIDEDGDGKPDGVAIAENQAAISFFRMPDGRCFSVQMIGTNGINDIDVNNFKSALSTIGDSKIVIQDSSDNDKKSKKDKKDKKSKKDKKK